jgi:PPOX class probable F420-dependent enzyme
VSELPAEVQGFLDEPHLAVFITLMRDGMPQATPVWVDHDGTHVLINTVVGHQKQRNVARDRRVAVCIVDRDRPGRYLQVRGRVLRVTGGAEALEQISKLSLKYSGRAYVGREGEQRVKLTIVPERLDYHGGRSSDGRDSRWRG